MNHKLTQKQRIIKYLRSAKGGLVTFQRICKVVGLTPEHTRKYMSDLYTEEIVDTVRCWSSDGNVAYKLIGD